MSDMFGKPSYGGGKKVHYFKIKDGQDQILRILPPYGSQRETGKWAMFYSVHFGYKDQKGKTRPFQSPEVYNYKSKMIEVEDPANTRLKMLKAKLAEAVAAKDSVKEAKLKELLQNFNLEKKWHMLAVDLTGKIGLVSIGHKHKLVLDKEIKTLQNAGVDPVSIDNGRFFVFSKAGKGRDTVFGVQVYKQTKEIPGHGVVEVPVVHDLTKTDVPNRMANEAKDLGSLYKRPTPDQVKFMMDGGPVAVEQIMNDSNTASSAGSQEVEEEGPDMDDEDSLLSTVNQPAAQQTAQAAQQVTQQVTQQPAPVAQNAAQPTQGVFGNTNTAPAANTNSLVNQSNDEFLKSLGMSV